MRDQPQLQIDPAYGSHDFNSRDLYMHLNIDDINYMLDNYHHQLTRFGYDLLYEVWLDAIEGRATLDDADAEIARVMRATRGLGNWGE